MENAMVLLYDICRICLDEPGANNIFQPTDWSQDIFTYTGVKVSATDKMPQTICTSCQDIITCVKVLKDVALANERRLQTIRGNNNTGDDQNESIPQPEKPNSTVKKSGKRKKEEIRNSFRNRLVFESDLPELSKTKEYVMKRKSSTKLENEGLPNDMENYMEYHVMGSVSQVRMKPGCMPHKFICQPDRKTRTSNTTERPYIAKKRRMMILEECKKEFEEKCLVTEQSRFEESASGSSVQQNEEEVPQLTPRVLDKSVLVHIRNTFRSKANKTKSAPKLAVRKDLFDSTEQTTETVSSSSAKTASSPSKEADVKDKADEAEVGSSKTVTSSTRKCKSSSPTPSSSKVSGSSAKTEGEHLCETCNKTYATAKKLYLHQLAHNKKFICPLDACGKKFATNGDLKKHIRSHTGEKPFKCNLCEQSFSQNVTLKLHKENVHNESKSQR